MTEFKDIEILRIMFPHMRSYDYACMSVNGAFRGNEEGFGVRLDACRKNDPTSYSMEGLGSYYDIFKIEDLPQVKEYKRLLSLKRKEKIDRILAL